MIAVIQRVNCAQVEIDQQLHSEISQGLLAFIGVEKEDTNALAEKMLEKILSYRVFADAEDKMNLSLKDISGELMLISQFTLAANTNKGLRASFSSAMPPVEAEQIYQHLVASANKQYSTVQSGKFAADMQISLENDGPVTFILQV